MNDNRTTNEYRSDTVANEISHKYYEESIKALQKHAEVANEEMSHIKEDVAGIKYDASWIKLALEDAKKALDKFDSRTWVLLGTIVAGTLITIAIQLFKK